jgi:pyruvate dehydrogenase E2 component (dihydrolipoamide acetyltransferase)
MDFKLPDIGEGVAEGEIVTWLVKAGDAVKEDQPFVEVMTDKATVQLPSPVAGTVKELRFKEGAVVKVGSVIAVFDAAAGAAKAAPADKQEAAPVQARAEAPSSAPVAAPARTPDKVLAAPATRRRAREAGIDLAQVRGTGPHGRVTNADLEGQSGGSQKAPVRAAPPLPKDPREERIPLKGLRRKIAEQMRKSKDTAAHFTYVEECDMTEIVSLREAAKARSAERGVKLTYLPFIIKALIPALREFPLVNSSLDDASGEIVLKRYYHIGIAVDTQDGLMVVNVRDADQRSLWDLAKEIDRLATAARAGKATREELTGSTFTITSTGNVGGLLATPIVNHPEVAILGVHQIKAKPAVREGQIVIRQIANFSISFDHRVVDGAMGANFLKRVLDALEDPKRMLLEVL